MRCRYCGTKFSAAATVVPFRATCPKCAAIVTPLLVVQPGDGIGSFREVMIAQNAKDPSRKLLETQSYHFTLFFDDNQKIIGFDLTDRDEAHLLKWRSDRPPVYYGVANVGKGYNNHHTVFINGRFAAAPVMAELESRGQNIRREVRAVLRDGIIDAAEQNA